MSAFFRADPGHLRTAAGDLAEQAGVVDGLKPSAALGRAAGALPGSAAAGALDEAAAQALTARQAVAAAVRGLSSAASSNADGYDAADGGVVTLFAGGGG